MLARVPDPRRRRGRRYLLVFVLAVAAACALAGARNFREAGDHAADLPQDILARLGGRPHPLRRRIIAPSETRIRTLIQAIGADMLDEVIGGWLRELADAVVTADAAHAQRETAQYIAGKEQDGGRGSDYFLFEGQPALCPAGRLRRHPARRSSPP